MEISMVLRPHFLHLTELLVLVNRVLRQWIQNAKKWSFGLIHS